MAGAKHSFISAPLLGTVLTLRKERFSDSSCLVLKVLHGVTVIREQTAAVHSIVKSFNSDQLLFNKIPSRGSFVSNLSGGTNLVSCRMFGESFLRFPKGAAVSRSRL